MFLNEYPLPGPTKSLGPLGVGSFEAFGEKAPYVAAPFLPVVERWVAMISEFRD